MYCSKCLRNFIYDEEQHGTPKTGIECPYCHGVLRYKLREIELIRKAEQLDQLTANSAFLERLIQLLQDQMDDLQEQEEELENRGSEKKLNKVVGELETLRGQIEYVDNWLKWYDKKIQLLELVEESALSKEDEIWLDTTEAFFESVDIVLYKKDIGPGKIKRGYQQRAEVIYTLPVTENRYTWEEVFNHVKYYLDLINK